ncbi:MAG: hypothetical protein ACFFD2_11835 [Promethearchaeota archaeon]
MSYMERSLNWYFRNTMIRGFSILLDTKFLFYSLITLIWVIVSPICIVFYNFLGGSFVWSVLQLEIAIIVSFLISGIIIKFIESTKRRILLTIIILSIISILFLVVVPREIQFYFPVFGSIIFAGVLGISLFINVRSFNTSWISRFMMVGKSPKKIFMHNIAIFINLISIFAPIFLLVRYFNGFLIYDLILVIIGFITWSIVMYSITHFPDLFAYDIFASILSTTYLLSIIFFFMYIEILIFAFILDIILLIFGISIVVQILHSPRKVEKVSIFLPKSAHSSGDLSNIWGEDYRKSSIEIPIGEGPKYAIEKEVTEVRSNYDGLIVILLGLFLCFYFVFLQYLGELLITPGFIPLPFQFTLMDYHFVLVLFGYCLVLAIYTAFKVSYRFRGYTTKTISERAAFFKFLSLIDENERKQFLNRISKTVGDILVGGLMELIEMQRRRWEEGLEKGRKFLKYIFRREEEEQE